MFWIMLAILIIVSSVLAAIIERESGWLSFLFLGIPMLIIIPLCGTCIYTDIVGQREAIISQAVEIESIRSCYYPGTSQGILVGGSLDNIKQSTELTKYVSNYAYNKANFNAWLTSVKEGESSSILWWFGLNAFIPDKVLKIEKI